MNEDFVEYRPGDAELYRRLDAFAQLRLAPDASAMAGMREGLVTRATAIADSRLEASPTIQPAARDDRRVTTLRSWRRRTVSRLAGALLAACLTVGLVVGGVAAAKPGGPLYGPRLWLEAVTLPSDPVARAEGQFDRLDGRLAEISEATANGDSAAATAAVDAYVVILAELESQAVASPAVREAMLGELAVRQVVLSELLDEVPPQAQDAILHALQQGANAVDVIGTDHPGKPARPTGAQDAGGRGAGGGRDDSHRGQGGTSGGGAGPSPTADPVAPEPEPEPEPTPKATKAPKPSKQPAPEPTPGRRPTQESGPGSGGGQGGASSNAP